MAAPEKRIPKKPIRDLDTAEAAAFLKVYVWLVVFLGTFGFFLFGYRGLFLSILMSLVLTPLILMISNWMGKTVSGVFYTGHRVDWSPEERFASEVDKARHLKRREEYDQALRTINGVLQEAPDFPEALYLKARILWEGFGNTAAARGNLKRIIEGKADPNSAVYRWAVSLSDELKQKDPQK
ncbi:MAG: tetratricopeptide repeat protein [Thermodesulfobacteriota bacterium]